VSDSPFDMGFRAGEERALERFRERLDIAARERAVLQARFDHLVKLLSDARALLPPAPIVITADEAARLRLMPSKQSE
jgi:hypothetical protein